MIDLNRVNEIYLYTGTTDFRYINIRLNLVYMIHKLIKIIRMFYWII